MFETRFFERPADEQELEYLHKRHTDVLDNIDATADEAKEVASDFRAQLKALHEQEQNLRRNLKSGTIPVEVEAKAVANIDAGVMEYFDRDGNLIPQLTHELSRADREQDALRKQLDMFQNGEPDKQVDSFPVGDLPDLMTTEGTFVLNYETLQYERVSDDQPNTDLPTNGDIFNTSPLGTAIGDYEQKRDELAAELGLSDVEFEKRLISHQSTLTEVPAPDDRESDDENPHGLTFGFTDEKPDIRNGINGAIAILTGNEKPLPKNGKKRKSEAETV